jgi:uncharacterized protein YjdB
VSLATGLRPRPRYGARVGFSNPALINLTIDAASFLVIAPATSQRTATGRYDDGTTANVSGDVTWSSSNEAKATVDSNGLVAGVAAGSAVISGAYETFAIKSTATVL